MLRAVCKEVEWVLWCVFAHKRSAPGINFLVVGNNNVRKLMHAHLLLNANYAYNCHSEHYVQATQRRGTQGERKEGKKKETNKDR